MNEHRVTDRLTTYWNLVKKEAPLPDFAHFNVSPIEDIWQQCIVFSVLPSGEGKEPSINFKTVGDKVRAIYGQDMTGRVFNPNQRHFQGAAIARKMSDVLSNCTPVVDTGQFINSQSKMVKYRSCLLPFGSDGKVTHIIAGLSWREF